MFADVRAFTSLAAGDNSIETWGEVRSEAGLSGNIPMDSNLSPPGNNPNWCKVDCGAHATA